MRKTIITCDFCGSCQEPDGPYLFAGIGDAAICADCVDRFHRTTKKPGKINQTEIAAALGISKSAVSQWFSKENGVPAERCPQIEAITGIRCEDLRPDVRWDVLRKSAATQKAA